MGFRLAVSGGAENISLDERAIEKVKGVYYSRCNRLSEIEIWVCGEHKAPYVPGRGSFPADGGYVSCPGDGGAGENRQRRTDEA